MNKLFAGALGALTFVCGSANAATIYFSDQQGGVGAYNTNTGTQSLVGSLAGFTIGQVIGLAYDPSTDLLYLSDRQLGRVYSMNASTGAASFAFATTATFQGSAYYGGNLYGISESNQTLEGYNVATGANLNIGGVSVNHTHGLGVDPATGQLYYSISGSNQIRSISADGNSTALALTTATANSTEDLDYYAGDFVIVSATNTVRLASSGATLFTANLSGLTGVAVVADSVAVPEPSAWALMIGGFGLAGAALRRRTTAQV